MTEQLPFTPTEVADLKHYAESAVSKELNHHKEISTIEDKINFIKENLGIEWDELAEALPTEENDEINPQLIDYAFATVSLLERKLVTGVLPSVARNKASKFGDRTMIEVLQLGQAELLLGDYRELFNWDYRG